MEKVIYQCYNKWHVLEYEHENYAEARELINEIKGYVMIKCKETDAKIEQRLEILDRQCKAGLLKRYD